MNFWSHVSSFCSFERIETFDILSIVNGWGKAKVSKFDIDKSLRLEN